MGLTKKTLDKVINFILKIKNLNNKKMREEIIVYSKEELLNLFPQHKRIDINKIEELLDNIFDNCKRYQNIYTYFEDYINSCFPGSDYQKYSYETPEHQEYSNYRFGSKDQVGLTLYQWNKLVEAYYLSKTGKIRPLEESCKIAADKWCEMLFNFHLQDNGAINEDHGGGFWACALATVLKNDSIKDITEDMIKKTYDNLYNYYFNGSIYKDKKDGWESEMHLYCDYGPNSPLYDILEESGIPEKLINNICPWKTGIEIDYNDNSVVIIGYQKREYI